MNTSAKNEDITANTADNRHRQIHTSMTTETRHKPSEMTSIERREEAFQLVDEMKAKIAGGASFISPYASDLFTGIRDALKQWGPNTRVSPDQLKGLRKINARMRGKKK